MKKRSKRYIRRRRQVIRNWICLFLVLLSIGLVIALIVVMAGEGRTGKKKNRTEGNTEQYKNDTEPPVIHGESDIHVSIGSKVKYKSYVFVEDNVDPDPKIEIDNSDVDLSREGEYIVTYTATDASGNSSSKKVNVIVQKQKEPDVDEATIFALADDVLDEIITDGMTDIDKVFAVFFYVRDSFVYVPDDNRWEYKQEAYHMLTTRQDSCYANACVLRLLIERLGFDSFMAQGKLNYMDEYHYWNMVSIDGGQGWYICDSAWWPWMEEEYPLCMMTDEFANEISERHGGLYNHKPGEYPATPDEPLWTPEERGYTSQYD
ncbi:MAG: immunoglobulin-like domain-containing protein [Lachnospiraceae bacterium]